MSSYRLNTLAIHAGQETADPTTGARAVPIVELIMPGASVLDLGCRSGELLALLIGENKVKYQGTKIDDRAMARHLESPFPESSRFYRVLHQENNSDRGDAISGFAGEGAVIAKPFCPDRYICRTRTEEVTP